MLSYQSCWKIGCQAVALALLIVTPTLAADALLSAAQETDGTTRAVSLSLFDPSGEMVAPGEFVADRLSDVSADEPAGASSQCGPSPQCDEKKMKELKGKVAGAQKLLFYNNNFDYLCDPCYDDWHLGDALKRRGIGEHVTLDIGGQFRLRQQAERNIRGLGLTGRDDDFLLYRTRLYGNVEFGDCFRVFAEGLDATSEFERYPIRFIEENRADMLNLFGDLRLLNVDRGTLTARVGRQELAYGQQRVISVLDWANTRRTFDGYKLFWSGEAWDADLFYTRPVLPNPTHFDSVFSDREFMGTYLSYKKLKHSTLDLYYLAYNNNENIGRDFNYDTFGLNLRGGWEVWLWDMECAYQSGNTAGVNHDAPAYTVGLGRKFECVKWSPVLWAFYDWAAGDDVIDNGYNHLYPLAHKYLGFMDLYGRRNIKAANVLLTCSPHERVKLLFWYYDFRLQNRNDSPYSVIMTPFNPGVQAGDKSLGSELDTMVTFTLTPRANLTLGYSHFFTGDYYATTPGVPYDGDADFFWTQFEVGF